MPRLIHHLAVSVEHLLVTYGQTDTRRQLIAALASIAQVKMYYADTAYPCNKLHWCTKLTTYSASVAKNNFGNFGGINPFMPPLATPWTHGGWTARWTAGWTDRGPYDTPC